MAVKDVLTIGLPGVPKRRGRPATQAQDEASLKRAAALRKRQSRARLAAAGLETLTFEVEREVADALRAYVERKNADSEVMTIGQAVGRILHDRLLRKR